MGAVGAVGAVVRGGDKRSRSHVFAGFWALERCAVGFLGWDLELVTLVWWCPHSMQRVPTKTISKPPKQSLDPKDE